MMSRPIYLISNDVVPGMALPVAGPGIRSHGLWRGLVDNGFDATLLIPLQSGWSVGQKNPPIGVGGDIQAIDLGQISEFLEAKAPCDVIITNSNAIGRIPDNPDVRVILDFFAPKSLEGLYSESFDGSVGSTLELRDRKLQAIQRAGIVVVNGTRKLPYYLGWILAAGRDPRDLPVVSTWTPIDPIAPPDEDSGKVRALIAGFRQKWSRPGSLLDGVDELIGSGAIDGTVIVPSHWVAGDGLEDDRLGSSFARITAAPNTEILDAMPLEQFREVIGKCDINIDAFEWNLERQYATVTRTVVALATGLAAIHPDFTEISPLIRRYDAGWLYSEGDERPIAGILDELVSDPDIVDEKRQNAHQLAQDVFAPAVATSDLAAALRDD